MTSNPFEGQAPGEGTGESEQLKLADKFVSDAEDYFRNKNYQLAEWFYGQALKIREPLLGSEHSDVRYVRSMLVRVADQQKQPAILPGAGTSVQPQPTPLNITGNTALPEPVPDAETAPEKPAPADNLPEGLRKCPYCAEMIKEEAILCRYCNRDLRGPVPSYSQQPLAGGFFGQQGGSEKKPRDPYDVFIRSLFIPGFGQIMLGQVAKGAAIFFTAFAVAFIIGIQAVLFVGIASAFDAYRIACKIKQGKSVGKWEWF